MKTKLYANSGCVLTGWILIPTIDIDFVNWKYSHKVLGITIAWLRLSASIHFYWDYQE